MSPYTTDTFFNGRMQVRQGQDGYRYSIDAVILAYHAGQIPAGRVLDLGTGCGIIPMIMAFRDPDIHVFGVEVQADLADLAMANVRENRLADRVTIFHQDMKSLFDGMTDGPLDLVVANPPFYPVNTGRINPNRQRAVARHEIKATLCDVMATVRRMVRTGGRFLVIYPAERLCDMMVEMRSVHMEPKRVQMIQPRAGEGAKMVLVEAMKGGKPGIALPPPLVIHDPDGNYTPEISRIFQP